MAETPFLKLYVTPADDTAKDLIEWLQQVAGDTDASNMELIDRAISELSGKVSGSVVFSTTRPEGQDAGGTWNEILVRPDGTLARWVREHHKNADGTYETVHRETDASLVKTADGESVQEALGKKADLVNDVVPDEQLPADLVRFASSYPGEVPDVGYLVKGTYDPQNKGTDIFKYVDDAAGKKQDKISGTQGQVVGFDASGDPVAQEAPDTGVTSFKGRSGAVTPAAGDYTAEMVGAATKAYVDESIQAAVIASWEASY